MFDDDDLPQNIVGQRKNLEPLSIDELEVYIRELKDEISRVEDEIKSKKAHRDAASSVFKS